MARSHGDGDLIAAIYDAVIEPSRWDEVVKRIVEATKSHSGSGSRRLRGVLYHGVVSFPARQCWSRLG